jgi:hypothetical protein
LRKHSHGFAERDSRNGDEFGSSTAYEKPREHDKRLSDRLVFALRDIAPAAEALSIETITPVVLATQ